MSIVAWFRTPSNTQQGKIVNRGQSGAFPSSSGYSLRFYDKFGVAFTDGSNNSNVYVSSAGDVTENEWHLGVGVLDRNTQQTRLFLDSQLIGTSDASSLGSISNSDATADIAVLKRGSYGTNSEFFNGKIQEVRMYNHALTRQEVQYLYSVKSRGLHVSSNKTL